MQEQGMKKRKKRRMRNRGKMERETESKEHTRKGKNWIQKDISAVKDMVTST